VGEGQDLEGIFTSGSGKVETLDVDFRRILSKNVFGASGETGDSGSLEELAVADLIGFGDVVRRSPKILFDRGVVLGPVSDAGYSIAGA
jgi:hypothetical protein